MGFFLGRDGKGVSVLHNSEEKTQHFLQALTLARKGECLRASQFKKRFAT